eukprot:gnl/TRDRNA2_/TRDRNA2_173726_c0_seq1.p1 gnl/TRDRNA2_/TRDRNA2_173726_c0~~gnl/TRDRNA2_/TRDRNA2_173726_c0_seq1.p1  ORF type:complete len:556 (-),score=118.39 gnl/TRDRNA2_/TRDRNA2_173726_c0_seq1:69-1568(-)
MQADDMAWGTYMGSSPWPEKEPGDALWGWQTETPGWGWEDEGHRGAFGGFGAKGGSSGGPPAAKGRAKARGGGGKGASGRGAGGGGMMAPKGMQGDGLPVDNQRHPSRKNAKEIDEIMKENMALKKALRTILSGPAQEAPKVMNRKIQDATQAGYEDKLRGPLRPFLDVAEEELFGESLFGAPLQTWGMNGHPCDLPEHQSKLSADQVSMRASIQRETGDADEIPMHKEPDPVDEELADLLGYTTVMLRNIPNRYTRNMLVDVLNVNYQDQFDFVYLPIDFNSGCNVGYAFINFSAPAPRQLFMTEFHGKVAKVVLPGFGSEKICQVTFARVQGRDANMDNLCDDKFMKKLNNRPDRQPLFINDEGEAIPFVERHLAKRKEKLAQQAQLQQQSGSSRNGIRDAPGSVDPALQPRHQLSSSAQAFVPLGLPKGRASLMAVREQEKVALAEGYAPLGLTQGRTPLTSEPGYHAQAGAQDDSQSPSATPCYSCRQEPRMVEV